MLSGRSQQVCDSSHTSTLDKLNVELGTDKTLLVPDELKNQFDPDTIYSIHFFLYTDGLVSYPDSVYRIGVEYGKFHSTRMITCESDGIISIPSGILSKMKDLEYMEIKGAVNSESIPADISTCKKLTQLSIYGELREKKIPKTLFVLDNLEFLTMTFNGCMTKEISEEILELCKKSNNLKWIAIQTSNNKRLSKLKKELESLGVCLIY